MPERTILTTTLTIGALALLGAPAAQAEDKPALESLPPLSEDFAASIQYADGTTAMLHGSAGKLRQAETQKQWLHLPEDFEVYLWWEGEDEGSIEPDYHAPWLLPGEILMELQVMIAAETTAEVAGVPVTCYALDGRQAAFDGVEGHDRWLAGTTCLTDGGIPLKVDLQGEYDLQGQEELMDWSRSYEATEVTLAPQPEELFLPPDLGFWNRPG